jgi:hypothetical protein
VHGVINVGMSKRGTTGKQLNPEQNRVQSRLGIGCYHAVFAGVFELLDGQFLRKNAL